MVKHPVVDEIDSGYADLSIIHHLAHLGLVFFAGCVFGTLADNANADLLVRTSPDKHPHLTHSFVSGGDSIVYIFEGVVAATSSDIVVPRNHYREKGDDSGVLVWANPVVTSTGVTLFTEVIAGGQKNFATGGGSDGRDELILNKGEDYIFRINNISGSSVSASTVIEFYERSD